MLKILKALLITVLLAASASATSIKPPKGYAGKLYANTLALYGERGPITNFICTATPYERIPGGYRLISAGHCVALVPPDVQFFVADDVSGKLMPVTLTKFRQEGNIDFAVFEFKTSKKYATVAFGDEHDARIGDKVIDLNIPMGIAKEISRGIITGAVTAQSKECNAECKDYYLVQIHAAPGSSGSLVISERTHKVIGVLIWMENQGNMGVGVEPISLFKTFMAQPGQVRSVQPPTFTDDEGDDDGN